MKWLYVLAISGVLLTPTTALGATFISGDTVRLDLPDSVDAYVAGSLFNMESSLKGDLIGAAQTLTIDEEVTEDVMVAGETIQINAPVGDDVRVAGSVIVINADVSGDVLAFGSTITVAEGVTISGDLVAYGAIVKIDGDVEGVVRAGGEQVVLTGDVTGDADLRGARLSLQGEIGGDATVVASESLEIVGDGERIAGNLQYNSPDELSLDSVVGGDVTFDESLIQESSDAPDWSGAGAWLISFWTIIRLFWAAGVIVTIMLLANAYFRKASMGMHTGGDVASSFGWGAVALFMPPVAIMALFISVIGIPVGMFAGALYVFGLFFSGSVSALFLSHLLNTQLKMEAGNIRIYLMALGIYVLVMVVGLVPGLSFLVWLGLALLSWGSLVRAAKGY